MSAFASGPPSALIRSRWTCERIWIGHLHLPTLDSISTTPTNLTSSLFRFSAFFDVSSLSLFIPGRGGTGLSLHLFFSIALGTPIIEQSSYFSAHIQPPSSFFTFAANSDPSMSIISRDPSFSWAISDASQKWDLPGNYALVSNNGYCRTVHTSSSHTPHSKPFERCIVNLWKTLTRSRNQDRESIDAKDFIFVTATVSRTGSIDASQSNCRSLSPSSLHSHDWGFWIPWLLVLCFSMNTLPRRTRAKASEALAIPELARPLSMNLTNIPC